MRNKIEILESVTGMSIEKIVDLFLSGYILIPPEIKSMEEWTKELEETGN